MKNSFGKDFYEAVYTVVRCIPSGKVSTYGDIARYLGIGLSARMVGWALNSVIDRNDIPCHRVVNRNGELTGAMHFTPPSLMKELLLQEGIQFEKDSVNLLEHRWVVEIKNIH